VGIFSRRRRRSSLFTGGTLLRWIGPGSTAAGLLYVGYLALSGGLDFSSLDRMLSAGSGSEVRPQPVSLGDQSEKAPDRIRIATFNIQRFGETKSTATVEEKGVDVMGEIARIVAKFDLVAIQELQGSDGKALERLVRLLNRSGGTYAGTMSDLIGEGTYLEAYAFVWDRTRIEYIPGSSYVVQDPGKRMHREPMVASFRTRVTNPSQRPFRFTVINVHTDPDEVDPDDPNSEVNVLADVFQRVREYEFQQNREDDFLLLGDLNAEPDKLGNLIKIEGMYSIAGDIKTNLSRKKTNDHILIDQNVTGEYAGRMGVVDFQRDMKLSPDQAKAISDHLPVWAEFRIEEVPPKLSAGNVAMEPRERIIQ